MGLSSTLLVPLVLLWGGLIIAIAGVGTVFLLNVFSSLGVIVVIARWKRPIPKATLPAETFTGATSAAFRYVRCSPGIQRLLLRSASVIFFASAFWALLPAVARIVAVATAMFAGVLAVYLFVFQGSMAIGSVLWGALAERAGLEKTLLVSAVGIAACLLLRSPFSLPEPSTTLDVWNHLPRPTMFAEPEPGDGPVLVTVEYKIDPVEAPEFLEAIHIPTHSPPRRRDPAGASTMTPNPQGSMSRPSSSILGWNTSAKTVDLQLLTGPLK